MSLEGRLQRYWMEEVMSRLEVERQTGILTIHGADDIIAISFLDGGVVFADALNDSVEDGLAEELVQADLLSSGEMQALISESQSDGGRLVDLVVEKGNVSREKLLEALRRQSLTLLLKLSQLTAGDYRFYSGQEVFFEEGFVPIPVAEILVRSAWELGESGPLPLPVPVAATIPRRRDLDPKLAPDSVSEGLAAIWDLVDGDTTVGEMVVRVELSLYEVCMALYQGVQAGCVELDETGMPAPGEVAEAEEADRSSAEDADSLDLSLAERLGPWLESWAPWAATLAILLLAVGLTVRLHRSPVHFVCPLPWEEAERGRLVQGRRELLYQRIDNAAKTFYLVEKRFPENLQVLVDSGLLSGGDLVEPEGYDLDFISTEAGYVVQPLAHGRPLSEVGRTDGVAGNILLDSRYLRSPGEVAEAPLILLD